MRRLTLVLLAALALALPAAAQAHRHHRWRGPTWAYCNSRGRCGPAHPLYTITCGGETVWSPARVYIPAARRHDPQWRNWCEHAIPAIPL